VLNSRRAYIDVFAGLRNWYSEASKADRELARDACA
jgi:hypothetical protein